MSQDLINRTLQSLSLPLYALVHDSIIRALKTSRVSRQVALAVLREIPKLPLSRKEQEELKNAKGGIELEDSFGSGNFFVMDAGSQEAFVCTDQKNANYLDHLLESRSDQDFMPEDATDTDSGQTKSHFPPAAAKQASPPQQTQENQTSPEDLLKKLQLVEMMMSGQNQPNQRRYRAGTRSQQNGQKLLQQLALLEWLRNTDINELLNRWQVMQLLQNQQPQQSARQQNGQAKQQKSQQQGQDLLQALGEWQLIKTLQKS